MSRVARRDDDQEGRRGSLSGGWELLGTHSSSLKNDYHQRTKEIFLHHDRLACDGTWDGNKSLFISLQGNSVLLAFVVGLILSMWFLLSPTPFQYFE